jgi:hypothetical protein
MLNVVQSKDGDQPTFADWQTNNFIKDDPVQFELAISMNRFYIFSHMVLCWTLSCGAW